LAKSLLARIAPGLSPARQLFGNDLDAGNMEQTPFANIYPAFVAEAIAKTLQRV